MEELRRRRQPAEIAAVGPGRVVGPRPSRGAEARNVDVMVSEGGGGNWRNCHTRIVQKSHRSFFFSIPRTLPGRAAQEQGAAGQGTGHVHGQHEELAGQGDGRVHERDSQQHDLSYREDNC